MKLYHGSNIEMITPDLSRSKPYKDFGQGFYLSADRNQAMRMAEQKTLQMLCGTPIVSEFEFDERLLSDKELSIKTFHNYSVEWARFVINICPSNLDSSLCFIQPSVSHDVLCI